MPSEITLMRVQSLKVDTYRQIGEHFRAKVQLSDQMSENEAKLHFCRGAFEALKSVEEMLAEEMAAPADQSIPSAMQPAKDMKFADLIPEEKQVFPDAGPTEYKR